MKPKFGRFWPSYGDQQLRSNRDVASVNVAPAGKPPFARGFTNVRDIDEAIVCFLRKVLRFTD
jgi:hypothetical protein